MEWIRALFLIKLLLLTVFPRPNFRRRQRRVANSPTCVAQAFQPDAANSCQRAIAQVSAYLREGTAPTAKGQMDGRGYVYAQKGCHSCHSCHKPITTGLWCVFRVSQGVSQTVTEGVTGLEWNGVRRDTERVQLADPPKAARNRAFLVRCPYGTRT
jgi:hypothetical protein